jgi:predicted nucleic acid-binding protein
MALYLLDTNILIGLADTKATERPIARQAVRILLGQGHTCVLAAQVLIEFWSVATRPADVNGLGMNTQECLAEVDRLRSQFPLLDDTREVFERWLSLVTDLQISGKHVHDIRMVALMLEHGITHILTLNPKDFPSMAGITIVEPSQVKE